MECNINMRFNILHIFLNLRSLQQNIISTLFFNVEIINKLY